MSSAPEKTNCKPGLKVLHKGLILVLAPLAIEVVLISALACLLLESDKESLRETRYRRCAATGAKLTCLINDSLIAGLGCYQGESDYFLHLYDSCKLKIKDRQDQLKKIAAGDPLSQKAATELLDSIEDMATVLDQGVRPAREKKRIFELSNELDAIKENFQSKRHLTMERMKTVIKLQEEMAEQSTRRIARLQALQFRILVAGVAANLAAGALLLAFYRRSISTRLQLVRENTIKLAQGMPLLPPIQGNDEISLVDQAFHKMNSDLKQAAERETALFKNASDVICVLDGDLRFSKINPACQKLWGYAPDELLGKPVTEIIAASTQELARRSFEAAREDGEFTNLELAVSKPGGNQSESLWSSYYSRQEGSLYCVVHDISERKQTERLKQSFLTMMSSDLQQPLTEISHDINQLIGPLKSELTARALSRLENAGKNIGRLVSLVNDLLKMTETVRLDERKAIGTTSCRPQDCSVEELLIRAQQDLESLALRAKISLALECTAGLWYADPDRIMQVVVNFGANAIKFSPEQSTVVLKAFPDGDYVEMQVIDQGRGVPESHHKLIFEKFEQVEAQDGKQKAGTGLGLPICKDIIEASCGEIGVRSKPGAGSTFWFRVPSSRVIFERDASKRKGGADMTSLLPVSNTAFTDIELRKAAGKGAAKSGVFLGTNMTVMQKGLVLILVPLVFEIFFVFSVFRVLTQTEESRQEEQHQLRVASKAYKLEQAYFATSQYVGRANSKKSWKEYDSSCAELLKLGTELRELVQSDPARASFSAADKIQAEVEKQIKHGRDIVSEMVAFDRDKMDEAIMPNFQMWAYAITLSRKLGKLIDEAERKEFINPDKQRGLRRQQSVLLLLGLSGSALLSFALARFFALDITSRLAVLADNAWKLARDLDLNPQISGADEIAACDRSFHETAEKLAEARRKERAVFDNSKDLFCILDSEGVFTDSNPAASRLSGYTREELSAKPLFDLLTDQEKEVARAAFRQDMSAGKTLELVLVRKDDKPLYMDLSLTRPEGEEYVYGVGHDISHRKELEQIKQDFLSVVSHDLRSPLTSMAVAAEFIREGASGPIGADAAPVVQDIITQSGNLIGLINDLLDLEKLEASKMQLLKTTVAAAIITEKSISLASGKLAGHLIELLQAKDDVKIEADCDRMAQALSNVILFLTLQDNQQGAISIREEADRTHYRWRLSAEVPSVNAEQALLLFNRISSGTRAQPHVPGLSILSLPLSAAIIKSHSGSITACAETDRRLVFRAELPLIATRHRNREVGGYE